MSHALSPPFPLERVRTLCTSARYSQRRLRRDPNQVVLIARLAFDSPRSRLTPLFPEFSLAWAGHSSQAGRLEVSPRKDGIALGIEEIAKGLLKSNPANYDLSTLHCVLECLVAMIWHLSLVIIPYERVRNVVASEESSHSTHEPIRSLVSDSDTSTVITNRIGRPRTPRHGSGRLWYRAVMRRLG